MREIGICFVILLIAVIPAWSQYGIEGSISGGVGGLYPKAAIAFRSGSTTFSFGLTFFSNYSISDLDSGDYVVACFQDINLNMFPDPEDPFGYYAEPEIVIITLPPSQSGINMTLNIPPNERFSGTVTNNTTQAGAAILRAFDNPGFSGVPASIDIVRDTTGSGEGPYEFRIDPGTYYLQVHMDSDGGLEPNVGESYGYYGASGVPQPIVVTSSSWPTGIDVIMEEIPLMPVTDLTVALSGTDIVLQWSPIPFIGIYSVYRGSDVGITPGGSPIASISDITWIDTDAIIGTDKYFYVVTASDSIPGR